MNVLNDSVIICESPKTTRKKVKKRAQKRPVEMAKKRRGVKRTYYESPLKHILQSNKRFKTLTSEKEPVHNTKERVLLDISYPPQESIIVLSDTENEKNEQGEAKQKKSKKRPNNNKNVQDSKEKKSKIVSVENNNTSCILIPDIDDADNQIMIVDTDEENAAPNAHEKKQEAEDIAVVWSSMKVTTPEKKKQREKSDEKQTEEEECLNISEEQNERLFMIDCTPDKKNLECLNTEVKNTRDKADREETENALPFSKSGMKLPKPRKKIYPQIEIAGANRVVTLGKSGQSQLSVTIPNSQTNPVSDIFSGTCTIPTIISKVVTPTVPSITSSTAFRNTSNAKNAVRRTGLREIVIDGNNVAMSHTNGRTFSEIGLKLVVDYFKQRGHKVKAFVPQYRRTNSNTILEELHLEGTVVFTPSRYICGRKITPYDDRFILQYATMCDGIVVSSDQFRDLYLEKPEWRNTILNRLLAPTFVDDIVMFPEDPLGRNGPRLDDFLRY